MTEDVALRLLFTRFPQGSLEPYDEHSFKLKMFRDSDKVSDSITANSVVEILEEAAKRDVH